MKGGRNIWPILDMRKIQDQAWMYTQGRNIYRRNFPNRRQEMEHFNSQRRNKGHTGLSEEKMERFFQNEGGKVDRAAAALWQQHWAASRRRFHERRDKVCADGGSEGEERRGKVCADGGSEGGERREAHAHAHAPELQPAAHDDGRVGAILARIRQVQEDVRNGRLPVYGSGRVAEAEQQGMERRLRRMGAVGEPAAEARARALAAGARDSAHAGAPGGDAAPAADPREPILALVESVLWPGLRLSRENVDRCVEACIGHRGDPGLDRIGVELLGLSLSHGAVAAASVRAHARAPGPTLNILDMGSARVAARFAGKFHALRDGPNAALLSRMAVALSEAARRGAHVTRST